MKNSTLLSIWRSIIGTNVTFRACIRNAGCQFNGAFINTIISGPVLLILTWVGDVLWVDFFLKYHIWKTTLTNLILGAEYYAP